MMLDPVITVVTQTSQVPALKRAYILVGETETVSKHLDKEQSLQY